jgi:hypothetical protein
MVAQEPELCDTSMLLATAPGEQAAFKAIGGLVSEGDQLLFLASADAFIAGAGQGHFCEQRVNQALSPFRW